MKAAIYISLNVLFLFCFASCTKNFLDRAPSVNLSEEKIFADPVLASQYSDNAYNHLIDEYARFNAHRGITGQAADEAVSGNNEISIRTLTNGTYHDHYERGGASLNDIGDVWSRAYAGIRVTNTMLAKMDNVPWTVNQSPDRIKGEMYFIRAFLYFELIKRFGGVIIVDKVYGPNEDIDLPRNTYTECVNFILADLEKAEPLLPDDYPQSNYGRATNGAAKALRSRLLLFAASRLNNETNDLTKWAAAAAAAKSLIDLNRYSLQATYTDILNVTTSPEYIMIKIRGPRTIDGFLLDFAMSPGSGGAQGQLNPTQNHVDLYEMKPTGLLPADPASGYDPQNPYANRDPRFYANILYNDAPWQGRRIQMWSGGRDYLTGNVTYTATRYYSRKLWPEPYIRNVAGTAVLNYIHFRYAEILLNYAEAQNEAVGPDASVYDAINQIRARTSVAMPPLPAGLTQAQMRQRIRNERAVELAFEDFRWYDIMRWKAGPEIVAQPMYGMNVVRNSNGTFTYNKELLPANMQKVYLDYMHRYPIPRNEIFKSKGILLQNTGW
ncbi:RagB/SusD family nutrient uptake outer membrane protein [Lacibacter sediminis]|uniref:RagB/SusD family nutrient uptake outer membrane protein n=1 Tax=Lacibacter sediminis TaxID=2760713 RepID=A0A7G5XKG6_9BACT|nr:RagB/SusD family nutrient uptake outer membrane protein [Lacibacter sediminis]QNA45969.1 RagB/SusD family nutrient uptake outer membrane protein [Lacibacter sediminis]